MKREDISSGIEDISGPFKWCRYIVTAGYLTVGAMAMAHIIWYFAAKKNISMAGRCLFVELYCVSYDWAIVINFGS